MAQSGLGEGTHVAYTSSNTWESPYTIHKRRWRRIKGQVDKHFPSSEIAQWELDAFLQHGVDVHEAKIQNMMEKAQQQEGRTEPSQLNAPFNGKQFWDGRGAVLVHPTVWNPCWSQVQRTGWPCHNELKYEGQERQKTGVRRMIPLPRIIPNNPTVQWFMAAPIQPLQFDHGNTFDVVPQHPEDVWMDYDSVRMEEVENLLQGDLLKAMEKAGDMEI
ncbi:hypothetical protein NA57DRAFT_81579 [Rhizodiscina lignyota]|uniref:Uncharacterized protein n=1 Tax=Rhizodiscina lignyota TaxID=1504668 RepID=A0A9P4I717_9PEZI|nr:hypothetical protein NA57DRAFT_81579 [Rhizodiscina lignyota]